MKRMGITYEVTGKECDRLLRFLKENGLEVESSSSGLYNTETHTVRYADGRIAATLETYVRRRPETNGSFRMTVKEESQLETMLERYSPK